MKLRRWVKDVMLGLAVFAIGTAAILTAGDRANSREAKQCNNTSDLLICLTPEYPPHKDSM